MQVGEIPKKLEKFLFFCFNFLLHQAPVFYPKFPLIEHCQKTFDVFPCKSMHEKSFQTYISALKELKMLQKTAFSSYLFFPRTILPFLIETHLITLI